MGTVWHSVAWHAFRRLGAAALAATGAAMAVTARWGRWKSERQAAEYATPPLDWECELPALLPWPALGGGATLRATSQMEMWPMAVMGGEASARAKDTAPIPIVMSDLGEDSDHGVLGPAVQADGVRARRRQCQEPGTNSGSDLGHAALQAQRRMVRVRVCTRCALRRRPPAGQHKSQGQQSVEGPPPEMSPPGEPTACGKC